MITEGLVVVAAGSSRRMQGIDKVWAEIAGHPVVWYSLRRLSRVMDRTALVVRPDDLEQAETLLFDFPGLVITAGGSERQDSVWNGLQALGPVDVVAIHDAARPFAQLNIFWDGRQKLMQYYGAIPVVPVTDTIKRVNADGVVTGTVDRTPLRAAQTPQVFHGPTLWKAHERARQLRSPATDDATLVERLGEEVVTFPGSPQNFKITTEFDLHLARVLMERTGDT